jgi:hypothetical protein
MAFSRKLFCGDQRGKGVIEVAFIVGRALAALVKPARLIKPIAKLCIVANTRPAAPMVIRVSSS